jgi:hypothetical protein
VLLVHGACPRGADAIAAACAHRIPDTTPRHIRLTGAGTARAAGQRRNAQMIALGADAPSADAVWILAVPRASPTAALGHRRQHG